MCAGGSLVCVCRGGRRESIVAKEDALSRGAVGHSRLDGCALGGAGAFLHLGERVAAPDADMGADSKGRGSGAAERRHIRGEFESG